MKLLRWLFFPVSVLYGWAMACRNHLYNIGRKPQIEFDRIIISVGNLSMGGTGKTPMVEYLIRLLKADYIVATLSRGYRRKTKGYRMANLKDDAMSIGDEPFQYYKKFGNEISVCVGEERSLAIPSALMEKEDIELFLLDDAFQHRKVARDFNILLTEYRNPFYSDLILPTGELREPRNGANRADCVIVTKCPVAIEQAKRLSFVENIGKYAGNKPVFFSRIVYEDPQPVFGSFDLPLGAKVILLTAIADNRIFRTEVESKYSINNEFVFEDHHGFTTKDLDGLFTYINSQNERLSIVTTEKDMVRLLSLSGHALFKNTSVFYIPIRFVLEEEEKFKEGLFNVVEQKRNLI